MGNSKVVPGALEVAIGVASVVALVATPSGGSKWAVVAVERSAFVTVSSHTAGVSIAAGAYTIVALVVSVVTSKGVPGSCVVGGGTAGHGSLWVAIRGPKWGVPLNEVGSGLLATAYVVLNAKELA